MKNTFYRPEKINITEFGNIVGKMQHDLYSLENEKHDEWNVYCYMYELCRQAKPLEINSRMSFFGLANPNEMPHDARVDFFYLPTYIATAFMIKSVLLYPSLINEATFLDSEFDFSANTVRETLKSCMLGCTGRNFNGAGVLSLPDCIKIFEDAGADAFLSEHPDFCPEFTELYFTKKDLVKNAKVDLGDFWY